MNREPTDAEVEAFKAAWEAEDARTDHADVEYRVGQRTRAGLCAVFALPQPLPTQEEALLALADTTVWTVDTWRAVVRLAQSGWAPPHALAAAMQSVAPASTIGPRWVGHEFVGRLNHPCETCGLSDRATVHVVKDPRIGTWRRHAYEPTADSEIGVCGRCGMQQSHEVHRSDQ